MDLVLEMPVDSTVKEFPQEICFSSCGKIGHF